MNKASRFDKLRQHSAGSYPASHKSTWQKTADYDQRQKVAAQFKRRNQHTVNRLATNGQ